MNVILKYILYGILLSISTLFAFNFATPDEPVTSDGLLYVPAALRLLEPLESSSSADHAVTPDNSIVSPMP